VAVICDYPFCKKKSTLKSRLSSESKLILKMKKALSLKDAYQEFYYCKEHHEVLINQVLIK